MAKRKRSLLIGLAVAALAVTACSPEATRTRGGGPGGDVGNRGNPVDLHGPNQPGTGPGGMFYHTPRVGQASQK
jgi:hypothetical protein